MSRFVLSDVDLLDPELVRAGVFPALGYGTHADVEDGDVDFLLRGRRRLFLLFLLLLFFAVFLLLVAILGGIPGRRFLVAAALAREGPGALARGVPRLLLGGPGVAASFLRLFVHLRLEFLELCENVGEHLVHHGEFPEERVAAVRAADVVAPPREVAQLCALVLGESADRVADAAVRHEVRHGRSVRAVREERSRLEVRIERLELVLGDGAARYAVLRDGAGEPLAHLRVGLGGAGAAEARGLALGGRERRDEARAGGDTLEIARIGSGSDGAGARGGSLRECDRIGDARDGGDEGDDATDR